MEHTAEWKIKLFLFELENGSTAQVVLNTGVSTLHGEGHAGQYPGGHVIPEIDTEIAAGRALIDLGNRLTPDRHRRRQTMAGVQPTALRR